MAYRSKEYSTTVAAVKQVLARQGVLVESDEFGTHMIRAIQGVSPQTRSTVEQLVKALTGGTVSDMAATRESKRSESSFKKVSPTEIVSQLIPLLPQAMMRVDPKLANDDMFMRNLRASVNEKLIQRESGGVVNISWRNKEGGARSPGGVIMSASGPFQYIMATWNGFVRKYGLPLRQYKDPLVYRADTYSMVPGSPGDLSASCRVHAFGVCESASVLSRSKVKVTEETLYLCHLSGASAAAQMLVARKPNAAALRSDINPTAVAIYERALRSLA